MPPDKFLIYVSGSSTSPYIWKISFRRDMGKICRNPVFLSICNIYALIRVNYPAEDREPLSGGCVMFLNLSRVLGIGLLCLAACACSLKPARPLTFEEQQMYMAKQQCSQAASDMNPDWPSSNNPLWDSYFVMCMHQFGISNEALSRMWY